MKLRGVTLEQPFFINKMMDLVQTFKVLEKGFRSGRWHKIPWEGDNDNGWAQKAKLNPGAAVHIFPKKRFITPEVICPWCKEAVLNKHLKEHQSMICRLNPSLMGSKPPWWTRKNQIGPIIKVSKVVIKIQAPWDEVIDYGKYPFPYIRGIEA